jgi:membrane protein DedA with SNARE-associated domain
MVISCLAGLWLGARFGRSLAGRLEGVAELRWQEEKGRRLGDWVVARPIPALAEVSVLFTGRSRMPLNRFILLSTLSNLAILAVYAAIGAMSATVNSVLLAMAG